VESEKIFEEKLTMTMLLMMETMHSVGIERTGVPSWGCGE